MIAGRRINAAWSAVFVSLFAAGCASRADTITAAYVSPTGYLSYSCPQLRDEAARVSARAAQVTGVQNDKATNDAVATTVGIVLFWPALFFIKGDSTTAAELSRLKGEMDAIEQANIKLNCGIQFHRAGASG